MIIQTTVHSDPSESVSLETNISVHKVHDTSVMGVLPFSQGPHSLTLAVGDKRWLWHDGVQWRVEQNGWGAQYAKRVVKWDALKALDPTSRYVIADEGDSVVLRAA